MLSHPESRFQFVIRAILLSCIATMTLGAWHKAQSAPTKISTSTKDLGGIARPIPAPDKKATVLIFVAHDCPISNGYTREISRLGAEYGQKGVQVMVVYAESELTAAKAREHASEFGLKLPLLLDGKHQLSKLTGAKVTPEAVVLGPQGKTLYRGRIDNKYADFGKKRSQPSERDLRAALDAVVAGKPVAKPVTTAIGCFIPETP